LYCVGKLEDACRLANAKRVEIAMEIDSEAKMNADTVAEAELFMERWRKSRFLLLKEGLIPVSPQVVVDRMGQEGNSAEFTDFVYRQLDVAYQKEITRFMEKRVSASVMEFMYERQPIPRTLDDMMACVDLWVEKQRRSKHGLKTSSMRKQMDDTNLVVSRLVQNAIAKGELPQQISSLICDGQSSTPGTEPDADGAVGRIAAAQQSCFNMHTPQSAAEAAPTYNTYDPRGACDYCPPCDGSANIGQSVIESIDAQIAALQQQRNAAYLAGGNKRKGQQQK